MYTATYLLKHRFCDSIDNYLQFVFMKRYALNH